MFCFCNSSDDESHGHFDRLETPKEKIVKIAMVGIGDCGKTTIIKQLKKINGIFDDVLDEDENINYIRDTVIENMKMLCNQSTILNENHSDLHTSVHKSVKMLCDELLAYQSHSDDSLNADVGLKIKELWNDLGIQNTLKQRQHFQIDDNCEYFFNKIEEITDQTYAPTFDDYIRIRRRSIGYSPINFNKFISNFGECRFDVPDVGGTKSERRKWWNPKLLLDPNLKAIIYVVPLSDYNLTCFDDNSTNRLIESINVFAETMIKGKFFKGKTICLLFNKYDLFIERIKTVPITVCFDDFDCKEMDPNNCDDVMQFIANKFLNVFHENEIGLNAPLRILRTTAVDTESVKDVFDKIMPQIIHNSVAKFQFEKLPNSGSE